MGLTSSGRWPETVSLSLLVLSICKILDAHHGEGEFSMTIHGIDETFSDSDPDVVEMAQAILEDVERNQNSETHGDYSYTDCFPEVERLAGLLKEALEDMDLFDPLPAFSAKTQDGRYGADEKHQMWKIHPTYSGLGYVVGNIMDFENIESAADAADEESRVLMAQAREEFGF